MRYFEDIRIGDKSELGRHTFTAEEIKSFAERYDPQPFHLDEAAAARSHFGALCASGWHTVSVCMRLLRRSMACARSAERARAASRSPTGPSPGFRDLKWLKPVYAGDTITYASEIDREARVAEPARQGPHVRAQHRHQSDGRAGVCPSSAPSSSSAGRIERRMAVSESPQRPMPARARGERSAARSASPAGAHALHDGYTDLI